MTLPNRIKPKYADAAQRTVLEHSGGLKLAHAVHVSEQKSHIAIKQLTNRDAEFYPLMGPFLAKRSVVADLGMAPWDEPGKRWYLALDESGAVLGFAGVEVVKASLTFCSAWVRPEKRCGGVYTALLASRLVDYRSHSIRARATKFSKTALEKYGFAVERTVGQYFEMRRSPDATGAR